MKLLTLATYSLFVAALFAADDNSFAVKGATVHTMTGRTIENGTVLVRNGKITGVGKNLAIPKDIKVIDGKGMQVYPGMIDAGTEIGLSEVGAVRETVDTTEIGKFNPQLNALTAVNPSSEFIPVTRVSGITTVATMPQGQLISGNVSLMHLDGWTTDEMGIKKAAGLHLTFPSIGAGGRRGGGPPPDGDAGGAFGGRASFTEMKKAHDKEVQELNDFFEGARRYRQAVAVKAPGFVRDLKLEAMLPVLEGKEPILITANRARDIKESIEWATKQKVKMILIGAIESYKVTKEIKDANIPVILGPTLALPTEEDEGYDGAFTTPLALQKAGIKFAFASLGNQFARNLPFQAAQAVAFGLPHDEAMMAMTKNAADIWGVGEQLGTIEEGKWADLIMTDGDPLEAKTQLKQLFIKGKPVELETKHKKLYDKYLNRPSN